MRCAAARSSISCQLARDPRHGIRTHRDQSVAGRHEGLERDVNLRQPDAAARLRVGGVAEEVATWSSAPFAVLSLAHERLSMEQTPLRRDERLHVFGVARSPK